MRVRPQLVLPPLLVLIFASSAVAQWGQYRGPAAEVRGRSAVTNSSPDAVPGVIPGTGGRGRTGAAAGNATIGRRRSVRYDLEGYQRWEFWWEHNKDRYLILWNLENRSADNPFYDTPDYYLGRDEERDPSHSFRVSDAERKEKILPALAASATSTDGHVRAAAALALAKTGDPEVYELLARLTRDQESRVRNAAVLSLGVLGDLKAVPFLLRLLNDPKTPADVRFYSAVGLGYLRSPEVTPYLLSFLGQNLGRQGQGLDDIKLGVLIGIGISGDRSAVPALQAIVRDGRLRDDAVRAMIIQTVGKLGDLLSLPMLLRLLESGEIQERRCAALALGELDFSSEAEQELADLLARKKAWAAKDSMTKAALEQFDSLIQSRIEERRIRERRLKRYRDRAAYRLAEVMKQDGDGQVRNFAAISLGKVAGSSSKEALRWGLNSGYSRSLQGFSALGLGLMGDRSVAPELKEKLVETYGEEQLRGAFALALGLLRAREAAGDLVKIVQKKSNQDEFRGYTAVALGLMGFREAAPVLRSVLLEEATKEDLARSTALALGLLGDRDSTYDLRRVLVEGRSATIRGAAVIGHGLLRDFSAVAPLTTLLGKKLDSEVHEAVAAALGYLVADDEIPVLSFAARDHNYRIASARVEELLRIL